MQQEEAKMSIEDKIEKAAQALDELEEAVLEYTMEVNREPEEVAAHYVELNNIERSSKDALEYMGRLLEKHMGAGDILSLSGYGVTVEKKQGQNRKAWDHKTLRAVVAEKIIDEVLDEETGSLTVPPSQLVQKAFDFTGLSWKVTSLRDHKINPDQYCEKSEGRVSFQVATAAPQPEPEEEEEDDDFI